MQRSNLILFIVLAASVLGGWFWYASNQNTPTEADKKRLAQGDKDAKQKDGEKKKPDEKKKDEEKKKVEVEPKEKKVPDPVKNPPEKIVPAEKETLGDEGFHLQVDLTTRGAGVRKVTLNHFKKADWRGRPTDHDLDIIQDNEITPSFLMYHYVEPKDENPVFGLGEKIWKMEPKKVLADNVHEVRYWTTVPDLPDVKIVKTYRLAPKDYHVTLLVEIHDLRDPKDKDAKPIPFRYQLTGGHGIPIEGEWYTATFRNAVMGLVDARGNLYRKLEESARISPRKGGDRFPENTNRDNRLQYAGVANQFFGVMIVVDNEQPTKNDGGTTPDKILAWARPTLETTEKKVFIVDHVKKLGILKFLDRSGKEKLTFAELFAVLKGKAEDVILLPRTAKHLDDLELKEGDKAVLSYETSDDRKKVFIVDHVKKLGILKFLDRSGKEKLTFAELFAVLKGKAEDVILLPRTAKHLDDLELKKEDEAVLRFYETSDDRKVATSDDRKVASWVRLGETLKPQFDDITVRVNSQEIELLPNDKIKHQFMLYHGPVKAALLKQFTGEKAVPGELVDRYTHTLHLLTLTDYPSDNFFGTISSKIFLTDVIILFTRLMHWLLDKLQIVFGYGFSIIVLTVIVRGAMFPISRRQAMFSIKMQELAPELKKIQANYPDDPQARMQAQQEFYRKHGINPLGSCWPVFLQMPIFLGLYFALQESIHFRLADILWIKNLAAPDMLIPWGESIPIISSPDSASGILGALYLGPYFNILPMIAVVFMMIQQTQTMPPPTDDQQAMQQKMLKYMTIFFGIMFYKVAAGLCIYFIASSLWGLAERKLLPKKKPALTDLMAPGISNSTAIAKGAPDTKWKGKNSKKDKEKAKEIEKEPVTAFDKIKALWREILKQAEKK